MLLIIAILMIIGGAVAVTSNSDTFSPAKFFLAFYLLFHVGAFFDPPTTVVAGLMAVPLFLAVLTTLNEASHVQYLTSTRETIAAPLPQSRDVYSVLVLWALSGPSIFAQYYMINELGGIAAYVGSIETRVQDWSGYGWARTLIGLMSTLNVAYFAIGLVRRRESWWWGLFALHFAITFFLGLGTGSRGGMLNILALLAIAFHYLKRPIGIPAASGLVVVLVGAASLFGVARSNLKLEDGQLTTGLATSTESFSLNSFFYGIEPLDYITRAPQLILAEGSTFLSFFTNAIPREIYPDKPDTGGVFFTINYAGNAWQGLSNLTPTFLGEWIINFGYLAGISGFFVSYGLLFHGLIRWYSRLLRDPSRIRDRLFAVDLVIYLHALWAGVALMVGEFTNIALGFVLTQLIPLLAVRIALVLIPEPQAIAEARGGAGVVDRHAARRMR
ncbi:MAG: O-antigen polymerase [Erythrobacter sp.]|uniref:O-antigen polymerase n=1 Tax=Erythrobacter sp. TaxID=1042 RepID=UPI003C755C26